MDWSQLPELLCDPETHAEQEQEIADGTSRQEMLWKGWSDFEEGIHLSRLPPPTQG
jgi:hypothetical protein